MSIDEALKEATQRAIDAAPHAWDWMPKSADKVLMIRLAQALLTALDGDAMDADELQPYALAYWQGVCAHAKEPGWSWEIAWAEFADIWDHGRARAKGNLQTIITQAAATPVPPELDRYTDPRLLLLGQVCRLIATTRRDRGRFFLAGGTAGRVVGSAKGTGAALLHLLCRDGILSPCDPPKHLRTASKLGRRKTQWYVHHAVADLLRQATKGK